jgi:hypothetical protein
MKKVFHDYEDDYEPEFSNVPDAASKKVDRKSSKDAVLTMINESTNHVVNTIINGNPTSPNGNGTTNNSNNNEKRLHKLSSEDERLDEAEEEKMEEMKLDQAEFLNDSMNKVAGDVNEIDQLKKRVEKFASKQHTLESVD